jgi:MoxR-like ATPase
MTSIKYYDGDPQSPTPASPVSIPSLVRDRRHEAEAYMADPRLRDAVNVALILSQPLLITGEPGTGKTQLAYSVGRELGYEVLKFETKSTSLARDLFYTYDTLRRFHDAQLEDRRDGKEYVTYNPLGAAIIRSHEPDVYRKWLPSNFEHGGRRRSVVLIDEVDKAPRDFPNDLLNELEGMYFRVPELGMGNEKIDAKEELRPVVIITSNSEKSLPDAFLRRCIYYDIPFPDRERLVKIVLSHMSFFKENQPAWLDDGLDFFAKLREPGRGLDKSPATAELLNWVTYLQRAGLEDGARLRGQKELVESSLSALFKSKSDLERSGSILSEWFEEQQK